MKKELILSSLMRLPMGIMVVDSKGRITAWNEGAEIITGFRKSEVLGKTCEERGLIHEDEYGRQAFSVHPNDRDLRKITGFGVSDLWLRTKNMTLRPVRVYAETVFSEEKRIGLVELFQDRNIEHLYKQHAYELERLVRVDPLTELPNRMAMQEALVKYSANARRETLNGFFVAMIDIDGFKRINDSEGHLVGDKILTELAGILEGSIRRGDFLGRYGGDEFIALLLCSTKGEAKIASNRIINNVARHPFGETRSLSVSVGLCECSDVAHPLELIERADKALYSAKKKNGIPLAIWGEDNEVL